MSSSAVMSMFLFGYVPRSHGALCGTAPAKLETEPRRRASSPLRMMSHMTAWMSSEALATPSRNFSGQSDGTLCRQAVNDAYTLGSDAISRMRATRSSTLP